MLQKIFLCSYLIVHKKIIYKSYFDFFKGRYFAFLISGCIVLPKLLVVNKFTFINDMVKK